MGFVLFWHYFLIFIIWGLSADFQSKLWFQKYTNVKRNYSVEGVRPFLLKNVKEVYDPKKLILFYVEQVKDLHKKSGVSNFFGKNPHFRKKNQKSKKSVFFEKSWIC